MLLTGFIRDQIRRVKMRIRGMLRQSQGKRDEEITKLQSEIKTLEKEKKTTELLRDLRAKKRKIKSFNRGESKLGRILAPGSKKIYKGVMDYSKRYVQQEKKRKKIEGKRRRRRKSRNPLAYDFGVR